MPRDGAMCAVVRCTLALAAVHVTACSGAAATPPSAPGADPEAAVAVVPVDPQLVLPRAGASASGTSGLVVLVAPPDPAPVRATVEAFFDAVVTESAQDLERVVDPAARSRASTKARPDPALPWWRRRFDALDYTPLASEVFFLPSAMEIHTARDASAGSGLRGLPVVPRSEEVLVRVPIVGQYAAKLMGDEIVFLLKPESSPRGDPPLRARTGYTIAELYEDFRLP